MSTSVTTTSPAPDLRCQAEHTTWTDWLNQLGTVADRGIRFIPGGEEPGGWCSWAEIHRDAGAYAAELVDRYKVRPGDRVALLADTSRQLVTALEAIWLAGACCVVLPAGGGDQFVDATHRRLVDAAARVMLHDGLPEFLAPAAVDPARSPVPVARLAEVDRGARTLGTVDWEPPRGDPGDLVALQYTSGTTSAPKGVEVTNDMLLTDLAAIADHVRLDPLSDVAVSWLPLFHDMGLFGLLASTMRLGVPLVLASPLQFRGRRWMEWLSDGTITAGPNFAYRSAARGLRRAPRSLELDLSRVRAAITGAEPIDPAVVAEWHAAGEPFGLHPTCSVSGYGMAEAVLAVSLGDLDNEMSYIEVDADLLEQGVARPVAPGGPSVARVRKMVRCGRPLPGIELHVVDPDHPEVSLPPRHVGRLDIRGRAVTPGYYGHARRGEWLDTGDRGFLDTDGQVVICGRAKDTIIVAGRNIWPGDLERAAEGDGVRPGGAVAFGVPDRDTGTDAVHMLVEAHKDAPSTLSETVARKVAIAATVRPQVMVVPRGTIPKTTSGKPQRSAARNWYLAHRVTPAL